MTDPHSLCQLPHHSPTSNSKILPSTPLQLPRHNMLSPFMFLTLLPPTPCQEHLSLVLLACQTRSHLHLCSDVTFSREPSLTFIQDRPGAFPPEHSPKALTTLY